MAALAQQESESLSANVRLGLEADGILNGAKHEKWHDTNIRQIRAVLDGDVDEKVAAVDKAIRDKQTEAIAEYSEPLARRLIEKVTVYDEKLMVELKSGLQIDVEA